MPDRFRLISLLARLRKDEEGSIWILFAILIAVIMGMVGLALDGGRLFALNNEMQDIADAAALAGARELDGTTDAITRATDRAQNLLNNNPHWAEGGPTGVQVPTIEFYSKIGTDPSSVDDTTTTNPLLARYIRVTTVDRSVVPTLLRAVGAKKSAQTRASAMATSGVVACNTQPMMLCNPMEPNNFTATPGQMFHLKPKQGGNDFAPGDFGLVDPPGYTAAGAPDIRDLLSQQSPNLCYFNRVSPRPGHATNMVKDGINIRFDRPPNGGGNLGGMDMTIAPNRIDGERPDNPSCNKYEAWPGGMKLPPDPDLTTYNSGNLEGVEIGSGPVAADLQAYWDNHYANPWPTDLPFRRYDVYLRELGLNGPAPTTRPAAEPLQESPQCSKGSVGNASRRVISVSIVNCNAWNVQGNAVNNIAASAYVEFFITEPSQDGSVYVEYIRTVTPETSGGKLHRVIQLVR